MDGPTDLAVSSQLTFQKWEWRWQRAGWFLLVGLVVAALSGVLGDGPLSSTQLSSSDGTLLVSYDRFLHRSDPTVVLLRISHANRNGRIAVHIGSESLHRVRILRLTPEPESEIAGPEGIAFQFASVTPGAPAEIVFHFEPKEWGSLKSDFTLNDESQVRVEQFVYP